MRFSDNQESSNIHNRFSSFYEACREKDNLDVQLMNIGAELVRLGISRVVSVCLLHKHYDIRSDEKMFRVFGSYSYADMAVSDVPQSSTAISWRVHSGSLVPILYCADKKFELNRNAVSQLNKVALLLEDMGVSDTFGFSIRSAEIFGSDTLYENSSTEARASLTSKIPELFPTNAIYEPSSFSFEERDGVVLVCAQKACAKCPSCLGSITENHDTTKSIEVEDLFQLGISMEFNGKRSIRSLKDLVNVADRKVNSVTL